MKSKYITIALHVLVWSTILAVPYLIKMPVENKVAFLEYPAIYFDVTNLINAGLFYFNAYVLFPLVFRRKKLPFYIVCILLALVLFSILKLLILAIWFPEIEIDEWAYRFTLFSTVGFILVSSLYGMALDNLRLEKQQKEIIAERLSAELKFYRSQLSPHFLFNALSTIISLGRKKSDQLEPSLLMLSDLLRYMLYDANETRVPIEKEVEYLQSYINLQRLRFGHDDVRIDVNLVLPEEENYVLIEPMLLLPFVENAFKHGIGVVRKPVITINLTIEKGILYFEVQNKFSVTTDAMNSSGIGISNVESRLKLLYGSRHKLVIKQIDSTFYIKLMLQLK